MLYDILWYATQNGLCRQGVRCVTEFSLKFAYTNTRKRKRKHTLYYLEIYQIITIRYFLYLLTIFFYFTLS